MHHLDIYKAMIIALAGCASASANDLSDALAGGTIWQKDRDAVCTTDFVGLRYAPIDDHSVRLLPHLSVTPGKTQKKEKSSLTIGKLALGETIVRWDQSMLTTNMEAMVYNKGDNGEITMAQYKDLLILAITELNKLTHTEDYLDEFQGMSDEDHVALKGVRYWCWEWENGILLLEASASEQAPGQYRPEFIRLKMGSNAQAIATGGADNIAEKSRLKNNVMKDRATGDTWIAGVPMVDQGEKGYCVPATVVRVFAYYGMDAVDQHAMAQLCDSDPDNGTYTHLMYHSLCTIADKFHFVVTDLAPCGNSSTNNDWLPEIRRYIDAGIPLIWGVQLGIVPEAGIPPAKKEAGHMRLIIGYNNKTKVIYYTDSWGAGHELKSMGVRDARKISRELYVITPLKNK
ncbi:MAG: hypothetical protein E7031_09455 [Akkermansiaceae bacterium]|nr:hypothetical protein [Akkermansiaceae bacterium]